MGGVKSLNNSSPSGRMSGPGGLLAEAAARRSLEWAVVGAARPWVEEGAGCVAGVPQAARSCLYLERAGSSWLGPELAGWLAVALLACAGWWMCCFGRGNIEVTGPWGWLGGGCPP